MKSYRSGGQKRKEATMAKESVQKLTQLTSYFSVVQANVRNDTNHSQASSVDGDKVRTTGEADSEYTVCPKRQCHFHSLLSSLSSMIQDAGQLCL